MKRVVVHAIACLSRFGDAFEALPCDCGAVPRRKVKPRKVKRNPRPSRRGGARSKQAARTAKGGERG